MILVAVLLLPVCSQQLHADTLLFEHSGSNNPTTEGWTHNIGQGGNTSSGSVAGAWYFEDTSVDLNTWETYLQTPDSTQISNGSLHGWSLSTTLSMLAGSSGEFNSIYADYGDGVTDWAMTFGTDGNGDPMVLLGNSYQGTLHGSYTVGGGAGEFHTYSLVFDPGEGSVDLFVDGVERISDYTGAAYSSERVSFGAGASNGTGLAHFSSVQFTVVPEPISSTLFIVVGATVVGFKRSRKK